MVRVNQQLKEKQEKVTQVKKTKKITKPSKPVNTDTTQQSSVLKCQVFISGIPYQTTQEQLTTLFQECGTITNVKLPRYQDTGRCRGYAHITFANESQIQSALKKDKTYIGSRYINVARAIGEKPIKESIQPIPIGCKTLFVKNLPYDVTEEQIRKDFMHCGKIDTIRMVYDSYHKHFKGFCYIEFKDPASLKAGLKMNGKEYQGRRLTAQFEAKKAKKGYKGYKKEEE